MARSSRGGADGSDIDVNHNVSWVGMKGVWTFYVLSLVIARILLGFVPTTRTATTYTVLHVTHFVIQFVGMHINKGTPISDDQGMYNELTFWEQLDNGIPWTPSKKFLMLIPVVLFLVTCHATDYAWSHFVINFPLCLILIVFKLPEMHRVRLFGSKVSED